MVIEQGTYDQFKRNAFSLLDYGRVPEVISQMQDFGALTQQPAFTYTGEQFEGTRVVLRFDIRFAQPFSVADVLTALKVRAKCADAVLRELWIENELVFDGLRGGPLHCWDAYRARRVTEGEVAFLMEVPYPSYPLEPTFIGSGWEAQLRYDAVRAKKNTRRANVRRGQGTGV